ncbi:SpoIID/LytB domain-containing protein [Orenia marismortui]|uniref:Stage II sporulation protein D n=1 Tax=Orenia marismortui TaxID=46469 RepID=A0A4R8H7N9_9FIRM|nr:SpoIID/LytB domain-containing protein [Orenia marismortui]TDX51036.1 stage II sporulation protein D [Orenia marismortui]
MKLKIIVVTLIILTLLTPVSEAQSRRVKVGLLDNVDDVLIKADNGIRVVLDNGLELSLNLDKSYNFISQNDLVLFGQNVFQEDRYIVYPLKSEDLLSVNGRKYRGFLEILNTDQGLTVINNIKFDHYLASVVGSEINANWPLESLKAQTVVARTYALRNIASHLSKGYNLSATVRSQAYKGVAFEHPRTLKAVRETKNEVATYQGELIASVYHSSAGGQTAQGSTIWGSETPYLQSVSSPDDLSPHYSWKSEYSKREIEKILVTKNILIKDLQEITLENIGPSGRPSLVRIHDINNKYYDIDSSRFRFWLGLRSTRFTIVKNNSLRLSRNKSRFSFDIERLGVDNKLKLKDQNDSYLFSGYGWGHGVGMSQWGAYKMSKEGYSYQEILKHYYYGIRITKMELEE